jgi:hypothetical protein
MCRSRGPLHQWHDRNGCLPFGVIEVKFKSEVYAAQHLALLCRSLLSRRHWKKLIAPNLGHRAYQQ